MVHIGHERRTDTSRRFLEMLAHSPNEVTGASPPGLGIAPFDVPVDVFFRVELQLNGNAREGRG